MSALAYVYLLTASILMLTLPRGYALLPLVLAPAYTPATEALNIAGATFTIPRLLIALGFLRVMLRGETLGDRWFRVDTLVMAWAAVLLATSLFHTPDAWLYRFGMLWTELGSYFLARRLLRTREDVKTLLQALAWLLVPMALLMGYEKYTGTNPFSVFTGVSEIATIREGKVRAAGPFSHPILAGTTGAMLFGFGVALWGGARKTAVAACVAGVVAVVASASSGPMLMLAAILVGRLLYPFRLDMRTIQVSTLTGLVALNAVMNDPVYFLMARVDLAGGSQGYFRAQLIRSSIERLGEWWLAGTDLTRHWMPTGLKVTSRHTDMTNHFLWMGVLGGVVLMALFVWVLAATFAAVGRAMREEADAHSDSEIAGVRRKEGRNVVRAEVRKAAREPAELSLVWGLGCVLAGLTVNFLSVAMFDQSIVIFWVVVALTATVAAARLPVRKAAPVPIASANPAAPRRFPWSTTP